MSDPAKEKQPKETNINSNEKSIQSQKPQISNPYGTPTIPEGLSTRERGAFIFYNW